METPFDVWLNEAYTVGCGEAVHGRSLRPRLHTPPSGRLDPLTSPGATWR